MTVLGGTATYAFRKGKIRKYRRIIGGKTGTLSGSNPKGITTWFTGIMPIEEPEVVVSAVVIIEDFWKFKAPNLAAEALSLFQKYKKTQKNPFNTALNIPRTGQTKQ